MYGTSPQSRGLNLRSVEKYSDFGPIEGSFPLQAVAYTTVQYDSTSSFVPHEWYMSVNCESMPAGTASDCRSCLFAISVFFVDDDENSAVFVDETKTKTKIQLTDEDDD